MSKAFCRDCNNRVKPTGAPYDNHPLSLCTVSGEMNFVTGHNDTALCKDVNKDGECDKFVLFEYKKED